MFDPTAVIHNSAYLYICRHEGCDYHTKAPARIRFNPLRLEIGIRTKRDSGPRWRINRGGKWQRKFSNFLYRLRYGGNGP